MLLIGITPFACLLLYWSHTTNSLALASFAYLAIFDIGSLLMCLVSFWASRQQPCARFSYGFERVNVLSVFSLTILLILSGLNIAKHCAERLFNPPIVATDNLLLGVLIGLITHGLVVCVVMNKSLVHTAEAASVNWMQSMLMDLGHSLSTFVPSLGMCLQRKINPFVLLSIGSAFSVVVSIVLIDMDELYLADVVCALFNAMLMCCVMLPLSVYSGKILLQTTPEHILPLVDKSLREASTLDGVLELKNEHFWSIAFGVFAGSLHVRVRRDANEQDVLAQVTTRLSSQLHDLTIQVVKDDWTLPPHTALPKLLQASHQHHHHDDCEHDGHHHSHMIPDIKGVSPSSPFPPLSISHIV